MNFILLLLPSSVPASSEAQRRLEEIAVIFVVFDLVLSVGHHEKPYFDGRDPDGHTPREVEQHGHALATP